MMKLDFNKIAFLLTLVVLAALSAMNGYRLEIGTKGLIFERPTITQTDTSLE